MNLYEELLLYIARSARDEERERAMLSELFKQCNSLCYELLDKIRGVVRDHTLDDGECFEKIEEIVCLFEEYGINAGSRHDFG